MVYFIQGIESKRWKIGSGNPLARLKQLQTGSSEKLALILIFGGGKEDEKRLHTHFAHLRVCGEWFHDDTGEIQAYIYYVLDAYWKHLFLKRI